MVNSHEEREVMEAIMPLRVLQQQIEQAAWFRPTAMMLPLSLAPTAETAFGLPIIRGDRAALIYEPPPRGY